MPPIFQITYLKILDWYLQCSCTGSTAQNTLYRRCAYQYGRYGYTGWLTVSRDDSKAALVLTNIA